MSGNHARMWWAGAAILALSGTARAQQAPTLDDVKKAWLARQDSATSFRVEWTEAVKFKVGAMPRLAADTEKGVHPPNDTEFTATCTFAVDGKKVSASDERKIYYPGGQTWNPYLLLTKFDGKTGMYVLPINSHGYAHVRVSKGEKETPIGMQSATNEPLRWLYCPLGDERLSPIAFERLKLTGRTETIRDAKCVELVRKDPPQGASFSLWCDPARDFLPVRAKKRYTGGGHDSDWLYRKDEKGQWLPTGWEMAHVDRDGREYSTVKAEVKRLVFAPRFADTEFVCDPPTGSWVTVSEDGMLKDEYLIRPDGSKRPLNVRERNDRYAELIKTNIDGTPYIPVKK